LELEESGNEVRCDAAARREERGPTQKTWAGLTFDQTTQWQNCFKLGSIAAFLIRPTFAAQEYGNPICDFLP